MTDTNYRPVGRDPGAASEYLRSRWGVRHSVGTLAKLRCTGDGPKYTKRGKFVDYSEVALDEYARTKITSEIRSTAEAA
jgi:hypothetical protein